MIRYGSQTEGSWPLYRDARVCQAGGRTAAGRLKEPKEEMMSFYKTALRTS